MARRRQRSRNQPAEPRGSLDGGLRLQGKGRQVKATFIKEQRSGSGAHQKVYRCEPGGALPEFVVVSAVNASATPWDSMANMFGSGNINYGPGDETFIFESDADGNVSSWSELDGSFKGAQDHEQALRKAGYEVDNG